ncbi:MAG: DinB family protein [Saprospiraceae bacterium]|nr:DinB family protein [Saprospiraceae bacterium]
MQTQALLDFFLRDLDKLVAEVEAMPTEESLWRVGGDVKNPVGTLALHIAGNLQHFIGAIMGDTGYVRARAQEFSARDVARRDIVAALATARDVLKSVLGKMQDAQLDEPYPAEHFGENRTTFFALLTLLTHLNYHLGQVNYLRRLFA